MKYLLNKTTLLLTLLTMSVVSLFVHSLTTSNFLDRANDLNWFRNEIRATKCVLSFKMLMDFQKYTNRPMGGTEFRTMLKLAVNAEDETEKRLVIEAFTSLCATEMEHPYPKEEEPKEAVETTGVYDIFKVYDVYYKETFAYFTKR